uniref:Protein ABHD13 n=1 Tax=Phallusia mammillata TaxID=59560 RepID=A0A6F9D5S0_9ASCI|nr:protein ABHD17B-like [Phallusia mammillata]
MKLFNFLLSRSHSGYTRLTKSTSCLQSPKMKWFCNLLGHYFCQTTTIAPFLLLPLILIYITVDSGETKVVSIILLTFIVIFFLGLLYQAQDMLLYHPGMPDNARIYVSSPPAIYPYDEVLIRTADGEDLHGFFLKQSEDLIKEAPTIIYFHGNAGNAGLPSALPLYQTCEVNILMLDYRGFGRSSGTPSESGLYIDGEAAVQYLHTRQDINKNKIVLFGHSLGGAVAVHLASCSQWSKGRIAAVIVENTFTNIPDTAINLFQTIFPFLRFLPHFCFKNKFESLSKVRDVHVPMLFIFGDKDEIVGANMSRMLYETAHNPRSAIVQIQGGTHNDTWCVSSAYQTAVYAFLTKVFHPESMKAGHTMPESSEERTSMSWDWQQQINNSAFA